ncbi:hypothetical protein [Angelakisella massiliensis]|uniref:hypothetical protein n=1 Tax=Angelakisella massiliensis TaxID=1871018 RepID=UPI001113C0A0|nr:hypothetical protein [Angelakisella massiliensis]
MSSGQGRSEAEMRLFSLAQSNQPTHDHFSQLLLRQDFPQYHILPGKENTLSSQKGSETSAKIQNGKNNADSSTTNCCQHISADIQSEFGESGGAGSPKRFYIRC